MARLEQGSTGPNTIPPRHRSTTATGSPAVVALVAPVWLVIA
ncbi:MAG TPA: hypothetical protein VIH81_07240 [Roseiarcus sp.]